jgi:hypothetical protein
MALVRLLLETNPTMVVTCLVPPSVAAGYSYMKRYGTSPLADVAAALGATQIHAKHGSMKTSIGVNGSINASQLVS